MIAEDFGRGLLNYHLFSKDFCLEITQNFARNERFEGKFCEKTQRHSQIQINLSFLICCQGRRGKKASLAVAQTATTFIRGIKLSRLKRLKIWKHEKIISYSPKSLYSGLF